MVGMLFFTLFWCGITAVFVGFLISAFYMQAQVRARYVTTEGTVLASKIEADSGGDGGTTYSAKIEYAYTVSGRKYTSGRYSYGEVATSDRDVHQRIVNRHPAGSKMTVYYDPDKPSESVLSPSGGSGMYTMIWLLQPFIVIGLGMLGHTVSFPARRRRLRRFLDGPAQTPCLIPTWGELREETGGLVIRHRGSVRYFVAGLVTGYLLATVLATVVLGILFDGSDNAAPTAEVAAYLGAAGVSVLAGWWASGLPTRKAAVIIDRSIRCLRVESRKRQEEMPLAHLQCWLLRMIRNPRRMKSDGDTACAPLLSALSADGRETRVHVFQARREAPAIARRAGQCLAELTGRPLRFVEPDRSPGGTPGGILDAIGSLEGKKADGSSAQAAKPKDLNDLT